MVVGEEAAEAALAIVLESSNVHSIRRRGRRPDILESDMIPREEAVLDIAGEAKIDGDIPLDRQCFFLLP
jgi:hypothetical protein